MRIYLYTILISFVVLGFVTRRVSASEVPTPFAVVLIDLETEKRLGAFPYDRSVYAKGIERLASSGAKGVVLKVFIDRAKTPEGDSALARAMQKSKVILQARLDETEAKSHPLPERFKIQGLNGPTRKVLSGTRGWIPLPELSKEASDVGFIDSTGWQRIPVIEGYRGEYYKSLYTAALELALDTRAAIKPGESLSINGKTAVLDAQSQFTIKLPEKDDLDYIPFHRLLDPEFSADSVRGKVVILGYDGAGMPVNQTSIGKVKGHRLFCYQLFSLFEALAG